MKTPNEEDINKTIASYMGKVGCGGKVLFVTDKDYVSSVDALLPVINKLDKRNLFLIRGQEGQTWWNAYVGDENWTYNWYTDSKSPSAALALACFYAIKEME